MLQLSSGTGFHFEHQLIMLPVRAKGHSDFRKLVDDFERIKYLAAQDDLSITDVAKALGTSRSTVFRWSHRAAPPGRRGPKTYLTTEEDVELAETVRKRALEMAPVNGAGLRALVSQNSSPKSWH